MDGWPMFEWTVVGWTLVGWLLANAVVEAVFLAWVFWPPGRLGGEKHCLLYSSLERLRLTRLGFCLFAYLRLLVSILSVNIPYFRVVAIS